MSDGNLREEILSKKTSLWKTLLWNVGSSALGMFIFLIGVLGHLKSSTFIELLGLGLIAAPVLIAFFTKGFGGLFKMQEYEVITETTYGDGSSRKTSDGGAQSMQMNILLKLFMLIVLAFASLVIQPIRNIIMIIKYAVLCRKAKQSTTFIEKPIFFVLLLIVSFVGGFFVGAFVQNTRATYYFNVAKKEGRIAEVGSVIWADPYYRDTKVKLYTRANNVSKVVGEVSYGDPLTVIEHKMNSGIHYILVNANGQKGWISAGFTKQVQPND